MTARSISGTLRSGGLEEPGRELLRSQERLSPSALHFCPSLRTKLLFLSHWRMACFVFLLSRQKMAATNNSWVSRVSVSRTDRKTGSPFNSKVLGKDIEWLCLGQGTKQLWAGKWLYVAQVWPILCTAVGVHQVPLKEDREEAAQPVKSPLSRLIRNLVCFLSLALICFTVLESLLSGR